MRWIQEFSEGSRDQRELLGGKGAGVAEMTRVLGADRVPAGFTITTEACVAYMEAGDELPDGPRRGGRRGARRARAQGPASALGDPEDPLLVSVRSGARVSMPGMLDTVLNLGLNDESVAGLAAAPATSASPGTPTGASCRCSATSSAASPRRGSRTRSRRRATEQGAARRHRARRRRAARADRRASSAPSRRTTGDEFPDDPREQLRQAITAVFDSWDGRARGRLPADQRDPRRLGHRGQRPADGLRQPRRDLRLGRRLQPRRAHRRADPLGRLPRQRPGRGRRRRHPRPRGPRRRWPSGCPRPTPQLLDDLARLESPLRGHAGRRVHDRGGSPVPAADPLRQAPRAGRGPLRRRRRRRGAADPRARR